MAKKTRLQLEDYFKTGDRPTQGEFAELIESTINIIDDKADDTLINVGTSDEKFVTVLGAQKVARKSIKVNGLTADGTTGNIVVNNLTGNAGTATKLATVRKINTIDFDGTADITLPLQTTITGNAATASKLVASKTINGIAFDGSQDIIIPSSPRIIRIPLNIPLINNTLIQNTFASIVLSKNKTYLFKGKYLLTTGTATHTTAIGFAGGDIAISSIEYVSKIFSSALNTIVTSQSLIQVSTSAIKVLNTTSISATTTIEFEGIIRTGTTGTTFIPQIQFNALPGGVNIIKNGSFIELNEIGINTVEAVG